MVVVAIGAFSVIACGGQRDDKPAAPPLVNAPSAGAGSATATATPKLPRLTSQQLADYKRFVKAGWAAQKQNKWADAVTAFEAALTAIPFDQRAETELGLSAMQAGDLDKAKRADDLAVSQAVDHKIEAMARFNYGALLEKTGDTAGALKQYTASLALRPNKTVQAAADRLSNGASAPADAVCAAGATPCECASTNAFGGDSPDDRPTCTEATSSPIANWRVYHVESDSVGYDYMFDDKNRFIAVIGDDNQRGRHSETTKLDKAEIKTTGGHRVLWLYTSSVAYEQYASADNDEIHDSYDDTKELILCVLDTPNPCRLQIPVDREVSEDRFDGSGEPKPLRQQSSKASVMVAEDGTATVTAVGSADDELRGLVGPHKLW
jgi:tetratricopeptide (TPR) repeat protein